EVARELGLGVLLGPQQGAEDVAPALLLVLQVAQPLGPLVGDADLAADLLDDVKQRLVDAVDVIGEALDHPGDDAPAEDRNEHDSGEPEALEQLLAAEARAGDGRRQGGAALPYAAEHALTAFELDALGVDPERLRVDTRRRPAPHVTQPLVARVGPPGDGQ